MTTQLRSADPAPSAIDPHSTEADSMLTDILTTPRVAPNRQRRRVIGLGLASAAAAAVVAIPAFWPGDHAPSSAQAFSVTKHADGSVEVHVDPKDFNDPAALQQALRDEGLRAWVRAQHFPVGTTRFEIPVWNPDGCAPFFTEKGLKGLRQADRALNGPDGMVSQGTTFGELTLHPDRLPKDGAFVLEAQFLGDDLNTLAPGIITCSN